MKIVSEHYPEHYSPNEKMLSILIFHIFLENWAMIWCEVERSEIKLPKIHIKIILMRFELFVSLLDDVGYWADQTVA